MPQETQQEPDYSMQDPEQAKAVIDLKKKRAIAQQKQAEAEHAALMLQMPQQPSGQPRPAANAIRGGLGLLLQGIGRGQGDQFMQSSGQVIQDQQQAQYANELQKAQQAKALMQLQGMQEGRNVEDMDAELGRLRQAINGKNAQDFEKWKMLQKGISKEEEQAYKTISDPKSTRAARALAIQTISAGGKVIPPDVSSSILEATYFEDNQKAKTGLTDAQTKLTNEEALSESAFRDPKVQKMLADAGYTEKRMQEVAKKMSQMDVELQLKVIDSRVKSERLAESIRHNKQTEAAAVSRIATTKRGQDIASQDRATKDIISSTKAVMDNYKDARAAHQKLVEHKASMEAKLATGGFDDTQKAEAKKALEQLTAEINAAAKDVAQAERWLGTHNPDGTKISGAVKPFGVTPQMIGPIGR
jgi:hypothetical protein